MPGVEDDGRMEKLLITGDAGNIATRRQNWQMNPYRGAMAQLALDLKPASMVRNDALHSR
jgi:hypothetical protein